MLNTVLTIENLVIAAIIAAFFCLIQIVIYACKKDRRL